MRLFTSAHAAAGFTIGLCLTCGTGALAQTAGRIVLDQHKAVYDLQLDTSLPAKSVESARGRIAFDFTGDACDGYALAFRQVTELRAAEVGTRLVDSRQTNFEEGDGSGFRFKSESRTTGNPLEAIDGVVQLKGDRYQAKVTKPKSGERTFGRDVLFPSAQIKAIITAARAGETTFGVQVFDGSEDGQQIYDTLAVIGKRSAGGAVMEEPLRRPEFEQMARWPVTISYFKQGSAESTPVYRIAFDLYENGVTGAVRMHYNDFSLRATMTRLDLLPRSACAK
jgi:hypothetical protein